jgi:hypothetical protein
MNTQRDQFMPLTIYLFLIIYTTTNDLKKKEACVNKVRGWVKGRLIPFGVNNFFLNNEFQLHYKRWQDVKHFSLSSIRHIV